MDFLRKRFSKTPKDIQQLQENDHYQKNPPLKNGTLPTKNYVKDTEWIKNEKFENGTGSMVQRRIIQSNRLLVTSSSNSQNDDTFRKWSPSPIRPMTIGRSIFDQKSTSKMTVSNDSDTLRGMAEPLFPTIENQRAISGTMNILRQGQGSTSTQPLVPIQIKLNLNDPLDVAIQATLQKTMDTFQRMVQEERSELIRLFPKLANVRRTTMMDQGPGTEVVTETKVQPDGSVLEFQTVRTRRVVQLQKSIHMVNGIVKHTRARALMEYQGPNGGYRLKLEENASDQQSIDADSENEDEDDDDRQSLAPSEISDTLSGVALAPRVASGSVRGDPVPQLRVKSKRKIDKAWCAAQELVESERRYVEKLKLLDQIFRTRVQSDRDLAKVVSKDKLGKLFSDIGVLYAFHNDHLLPQLESSLREWQQTQKICDVMRRQAPFLKIYAEYTSNYKKTMKVYEDLKKSSRRFAALISEIEKLPECDHLPLSNHLICPVQRVTRYHLLMTEYLKNLTDGHPDKEDTKHALELTKEAAAHANEMMRHLDKYKNVIEVQELLGSQIHDLLTPSRELIKKGRLMKISARNGEHQTRFVFLFNDMLLVCSERRSMVMSAWASKYKLRAIFEVDGMQVLQGDNLDVENTFYVRSGNKMVEFYASEAREKLEWMETLWSVIQDYKKRMQSFRRPQDKHKTSQPIPETNAKPKNSNSINAESCSNCSAIFNAFKKSYICKSCGVVVCKKCCQKKVKLQGNEKQRVCLNCYDTLKISTVTSGETATAQPRGTLGKWTLKVKGRKTTSTQPTPSSQASSRKNVFDVKPSDKCIWSGYLELKTASRKSWDKRYFALHEDFVLYTFRTDKDLCAKTSLPITGCRISWVDTREDSNISNKDANAFKLEHSRRVYYLKANTPEQMAKCVAALELASQAQLPASGA